MPDGFVNPEMIRVMETLYFAGGITVIALGGLGTIAVVLGIIKAKYLKPYKNKYPYERYTSFEEFASKRPAQAESIAANEFHTPQQLKKKEKVLRESPKLTWENASDEIPSLSAEEFKNLRRENHTETEKLSTIENAMDDIQQTEELVIS